MKNANQDLNPDSPDSMPSDGCGRSAVPLAVDQWCDFHEFGCHLGNVGLSDGRVWPDEQGCRIPGELRNSPPRLPNLYLRTRFAHAAKDVRWAHE